MKLIFKIRQYYIIFIFSFFCFTYLIGSEDSIENINEKFKFIKDIYSKSWALIIGIEDYQYVDPLSFAVDDAVAVSNILQNKYGFNEENILLITNEEATRDNIMSGFQKILLQAEENDRIVVFYAGHGATYPLPNGGDMGYLIPVDGNASKDKIFLTSISMSRMEELANMSAAKHILYLIDACYGGLTLATRGLGEDQTPEYLRKMTKEKGRQVITAGGKDEKVMEKAEWGHSAFTKNLLHGLENDLADANNDGIISGEELGIFIKSGVNIDTDGQHIPQKGRMGSDVGEFVFISKTLKNSMDGIVPNDLEKDEKLAAVDAELAEIKKLLQIQLEEKNISNLKPSINKISKNRNSKFKTASTLSILFPGAGHYYTGMIGKGLFFTTIELLCLSAALDNEYRSLSDDYLRAEVNLNTPSFHIESSNNDCDATCQYSNYKNYVEDLLNKKNAAQVERIIAGTVGLGVWAWNIIDLRKTKSVNYSDNSKFSIRINNYGQIEARVNF